MGTRIYISSVTTTSPATAPSALPWRWAMPFGRVVAKPLQAKGSKGLAGDTTLDRHQLSTPLDQTAAYGSIGEVGR